MCTCIIHMCLSPFSIILWSKSVDSKCFEVRNFRMTKLDPELVPMSAWGFQDVSCESSWKNKIITPSDSSASVERRMMQEERPKNMNNSKTLDSPPAKQGATSPTHKRNHMTSDYLWLPSFLVLSSFDFTRFHLKSPYLIALLSDMPLQFYVNQRHSTTKTWNTFTILSSNFLEVHPLLHHSTCTQKRTNQNKTQ